MKARQLLFVPFPGKAPPIPASKMPAVARKYEQKYNIKIVINGETAFGKAILDQIKEPDVGLNDDQVEQEVIHLQKTLKEGERVGYVYTNGHRLIPDHFEVLIISPTNIYRPADWNDSLSKFEIYSDFNGVFVDSNLHEFVQVTITWHSKEYRGELIKGLPRPQLSNTECAALGMLYLKELLKNNCQQMKDYTLTIPYYDRFDTLQYLLIPSPHLLRYSQSDVYNQVIRAMIENENAEPTIVKHHKPLIHKECAVFSIAFALQETMRKSADNEDLHSECEMLLKLLPDFRKRWLAEYDKAMQKRETMHNGEENRYLSSKTLCMHLL